MGLFSFLNNNKDPFIDAKEKFLKTQEAGLLYSNLKFYMGYKLSDMNNDVIKKKVLSAFSELVAYGISYMIEPIFRSESSFSIYKLLTSICKCDYELAKQFESDVFYIFRIDCVHRFGLGE